MCIALILQYNLFVTPEKLEQTHREILTEVSQVYITKTEIDKNRLLISIKSWIKFMTL